MDKELAECFECGEKFSIDDVCINEAGIIRCVYCLGFKERDFTDCNLDIDDIIADSNKITDEEEACG